MSSFVIYYKILLLIYKVDYLQINMQIILYYTSDY